MLEALDKPSEGSWTNGTSSTPTVAEPSNGDVELELSHYVSRLGKMSVQLRQTSGQIEESVVGVCQSFQGIAERARATVSRATSFLGEEDATSNDRSFEDLIEACAGALVKIMNTTAEAGEVSRRAIERVRQMDKASQQISAALGQLEDIARGNKMLALNARIEASHAGGQGAGFAVVAVEVNTFYQLQALIAVELASQTDKSRKVTAQVGEFAAALRALAESTVEDLLRMNDRDRERVEECRTEVDESMMELRAAHERMAQIMNGMTQDGALLATDIGSAVRGLQFQDRISQRIAHVVEDLETIQRRLVSRFGNITSGDGAAEEGFSAYTMQEEREVAGIQGTEAVGGEVELF